MDRATWEGRRLERSFRRSAHCKAKAFARAVLARWVDRLLPTASCHAIEASWHDRSEEHTSELQSLMRISYGVICLKKKTTRITNTNQNGRRQPKRRAKQMKKNQTIYRNADHHVKQKSQQDVRNNGNIKNRGDHVRPS